MPKRANRANELLRFIGGGALNTGITYSLYLILEIVLFYQVAYAIAYIFGIIFSYLFNALIVFRVPLSWRGCWLYPLVYFAQYAISASFLAVAVENFSIPERYGPLVVVVLMVPVTFLLSKLAIARKNI